MSRRGSTRADRRRFDWPAALAVGLGLLSVFGSQFGCQSSSTAYNMEGVRLYQQGQSQAALNEFQQAIAMDPGDPEGYYNLAAVYHQMGSQQRDRRMLDQAENIYHQCLDLNPDHVDCHRALGVLLVETGRSDKAFTLLERWVERSPQVADAHIELARMYEEFGDRRIAEQHLTQSLALDARNSRAWSALARLREQQGDLAQALSNYQQSYQLNRSQADVATRIAQLQQQVTAPSSWTGGASNSQLARQPRPFAR